MQAATAELIKRLEGRTPKTALVLGSGLGTFVEQIKDAIRISYAELEGFSQNGVSGHAGELVSGTLNGESIIVLSGRTHYYEQGDASAMRLPISVLQAVGVERLVLTNSAGSLREDLSPGSVMLITDHINWSGMNPLIGEPSDARFVGMTNAYNQEMKNSIRDAAKIANVNIGEGVYMWFSGPSFETPAEVKMARMLGADAVGMSTVPEVILARFVGLEVAALSVITNYGAGMTDDELSHDETKDMAPIGGEKLGLLLAAWLGAKRKQTVE